jgi:hypothetical protein
LLQKPTELTPIHYRHNEVRHDEVRPTGSSLFKCFQTVSGFGDVKARLAERITDALEDKFVVVDNQDFFGHATPMIRVAVGYQRMVLQAMLASDMPITISDAPGS